MTEPLTSSVLIRSWDSVEATGLRAAATDGVDHMVGHFAVFDRFTEINSRVEGHFLERIGIPAFNRTLASKRAKQIRVLYEHGKDPQIGNKPLGAPDEIAPDEVGMRYDVSLFNAGYVNDLKPAIGSGQLGASFRMKINDVERVYPKKATEANPQMLEERTILDLDLYEFGPVTFGAYADATSGLRSRTDWFVDELLTDKSFIARFVDRIGAANFEALIQTLPVADRSELQETDEPGAARGLVIPKNRFALFAKAKGITPEKE